MASLAQLGAGGGNKNGASDRQIQARRRQEESLQSAERAVGGDKVLRQYAHWENKTQTVIDRNQLFKRVDHVQARHDETLEKRRRRLAELLSAEALQYETELDSMTETQEQRRDRIAQLALQLRAERERERRAFADKQTERAFQQNCPELLEASSKVRLLQTCADRQQQLDWAKQKEQQEKAENEYFDALWEEGRQKMVKRADDDKAKQMMMKEQLQTNLATRKEAAAKLKAEREEQERLDGEQFRDELRRGAAEDAEKERRRRERQHALGRQNKAYNHELEQYKDGIKAAEKEEEKKFLDALLSRIKDDEKREQEVKREAREAAVAHMKAVERQMMSAADAETELDRLWQIESNKEWDKKEARWRRDQAKRDAILKDTYEGRAHQIVAKRQAQADSRSNNEAERNEMIRRTEELREREISEARARFDTAKRTQVCLKDQMSMKENEEARQKREELEALGAKLAEREYQGKVAKEIGAIEQRKPGQYANLSLTKAKRF
eukprot:TRINITY_DN27173_c0_g1_i1.p1 TRINITY_DN27173_c0_g1~~TRINITY_DN27173_c0_g1_i1.p1  ORF type:complete len:498 (+),score=249.37 TRINITY_DN27173_c0_g1_i1:61-1554(+)